MGMGDGVVVARVRPEAADYAQRHLGKDMSQIFISKAPPKRPNTAPPKMPQPLPGFESIVVGVKAPRVKVSFKRYLSSCLLRDYFEVV